MPSVAEVPAAVIALRQPIRCDDRADAQSRFVDAMRTRRPQTPVILVVFRGADPVVDALHCRIERADQARALAAQHQVRANQADRPALIDSERLGSVALHAQRAPPFVSEPRRHGPRPLGQNRPAEECRIGMTLARRRQCRAASRAEPARHRP